MWLLRGRAEVNCPATIHEDCEDVDIARCSRSRVFRSDSDSCSSRMCASYNTWVMRNHATYMRTDGRTSDSDSDSD